MSNGIAKPVTEEVQYNLRSRANGVNGIKANGSHAKNGIANGTHQNGVSNGSVVQNGVKDKSHDEGDNKKQKDHIHVSHRCICKS